MSTYVELAKNLAQTIEAFTKSTALVTDLIEQPYEPILELLEKFPVIAVMFFLPAERVDKTRHYKIVMGVLEGTDIFFDVDLSPAEEELLYAADTYRKKESFQKKNDDSNIKDVEDALESKIKNAVEENKKNYSQYTVKFQQQIITLIARLEEKAQANKVALELPKRVLQIKELKQKTECDFNIDWMVQDWINTKTQDALSEIFSGLVKKALMTDNGTHIDFEEAEKILKQEEIFEEFLKEKRYCLEPLTKTIFKAANLDQFNVKRPESPFPKKSDTPS